MKQIVFYWENFGPMHVDRVKAVVEGFHEYEVVGLQLSTVSSTYQWRSRLVSEFRVVTLFKAGVPWFWFARLCALIAAYWRIGRGTYYLCHYSCLDTMAFAWFLRLLGNDVFTMGDSKFDDCPRKHLRETLKSVFLWPYAGALSAGTRSRDYLRFLGLSENKIYGGYDTVSIDRIEEDSGFGPAPDGGAAFAERDFVVVARLVSKKNLATVIKAYSLYRADSNRYRKLVLCGAGPLESELRTLVSHRADYRMRFDSWGTFQAMRLALNLRGA